MWAGPTLTLTNRMWQWASSVPNLYKGPAACAFLRIPEPLYKQAGSLIGKNMYRGYMKRQGPAKLMEEHEHQGISAETRYQDPRHNTS